MAPFTRLSDKVEARARQVAHLALHGLEIAIAEVPDVMLRREGNVLVLSGRGLKRRWIGDMRLRFAFWRRG
jgi:hypothetical protein